MIIDLFSKIFICIMLIVNKLDYHWKRIRGSEFRQVEKVSAGIFREFDYEIKSNWGAQFLVKGGSLPPSA